MTYQHLYPGVDLVWSGVGGRLEYSFVVAPTADPRRITLTFKGQRGVQILSKGGLVLSTPLGDIREPRPFIYQIVHGRRESVPGGFEARPGGRIGFHLGPYDRSLPLVIDPVVEYSSFLGGRGLDFGDAIAVGSDGSIYLGGSTSSLDFPLAGGNFQPGLNGDFDGFVARLNPAGSALVYSAYLGGVDDDYVAGVAVDGSGQAYVTGLTYGDGFPTTPGSLQPTYGGGYCDGFVSKVDASGYRLLYSTYLGGSLCDGGHDIALDNSGAAYVAGGTQSEDFPTTVGVFQRRNSRHGDAFVAKLDPEGSALLYSSYLGGGGYEGATAIAVDGSGHAYLTGNTSSQNFPTTAGAFQTAFGGNDDAFVTKVSPDASTLAYSTYLGGHCYDFGNDLELDTAGSAFVTGDVGCEDFPVTPGAFQPASGGYSDGFVTKVSPEGSSLIYSSFLGGKLSDGSSGIAVDAQGAAYVVGGTYSASFPRVKAFQVGYRGFGDAFVAEIAPSGSGLAYSSYLGGRLNDLAGAVAVDGEGNAYLTGWTESAGFPTAGNPFQKAFRTGPGYRQVDAFIVKIAVGKATSVQVHDGFSPQAVQSPQGGTVQWNMDTFQTQYHSIVDRTGLGLFGSAFQPAPTYYSFAFAAAGSYLISDRATGATGTVAVPTIATPTVGTTGTTFTILWSVGSLAGFVFDVQIERPGSSTFEPWQRGQSAPDGSFVPDQGPGVYSFRARLRSVSSSAASGWSPSVSIDVE